MKDKIRTLRWMYDIAGADAALVNAGLRRRKKSKKARKRLVRSICNRRQANGPFERRVVYVKFIADLSAMISAPMNYEGLARQVFKVTKVD